MENAHLAGRRIVIAGVLYLVEILGEFAVSRGIKRYRNIFTRHAVHVLVFGVLDLLHCRLNDFLDSGFVGREHLAVRCGARKERFFEALFHNHFVIAHAAGNEPLDTVQRYVFFLDLLDNFLVDVDCDGYGFNLELVALAARSCGAVGVCLAVAETLCLNGARGGVAAQILVFELGRNRAVADVVDNHAVLFCEVVVAFVAR